MFKFSDTIRKGDVIAVGDIHGMARLYIQFLNWVYQSGASVVLLGDLIDRGEDDVTVLNRTYDLLQDPFGWGLEGFSVVRGNHEQMFLNVVDGYGWSDWVKNGGAWEDYENLKKHAHWIQELPYYVTIGETLFSHAGVIPGENPVESLKSHTLREKFLWNRGTFLKVGPQFEQWNPHLKKVVFGHTPESALPYFVKNGVCIDTAAYQTGVLTAYNVTQDTYKQFEFNHA